MVMNEELLPSEAQASLNEGEKRVKLVMTVFHSIPNVGDFSLFYDMPAEQEQNDTPASYFGETNIDPEGPSGEEHLISECRHRDCVPASSQEVISDDDDTVKQLSRMPDQLLEEGKPQGEVSERYVIRCDGVMRMRNGDIIIAYDEQNDDMGLTRSEIVVHAGKQDMVSIVRTGAVSNTLVCERGQRHVSAYETTVMPFQICVFTKECEHDLSFANGGTIFMNYYVELRGSEMQHSKMRISVVTPK